MFTLTEAQLRRTDNLLEARFERRLAELLRRHFFDGPLDSLPPLADEMLPYIGRCAERAREMGIVAHRDIARFCAWAAANLTLNSDERELFRKNISVLFVRPGTSGTTALALADYRLGRMVSTHRFAARLADRMKSVCDALA